MLKAVAIAVGAGFLLGWVGAAGADEKVKLDEVPAAVRATINREVQGGQIKEIERETKDGRRIYEVEYTRDGREYEIHIAEDGKIVKRK